MSVKYRTLLPLTALTAVACLLGVTTPLACSAGTVSKGAGGTGNSGGSSTGGTAGSGTAGSGTAGSGTAGSGTSGAAGSGTAGTAGDGSSGAAGSAVAGASGASGSGASGAAGSGTSGAAGSGTSGAAGSSSGSAGMDAGNCNTLQIVPMPVVPTVLLLVDTSSSMFDTPQSAPPWTPLYNALMDPTTGVVKGLQDKVRFGFTSYNDVTQPVLDPTCPKLRSVGYNLNNYAAIDTAYKAAGAAWAPGAKWETPTAESVAAVSAGLVADNPGQSGPKYIVLVTDGNPDTCAVRDPQCGQDATIKAIQDAYKANIGTYVIGTGDILNNSPGCTGRCGLNALQDFANAGTGQPVVPPPDFYNNCIPQGQNPMGAATYAGTVAAGGTAKYYTASNQAALQTALSGLLNAVRSCSFDMNAYVTGDASLGTVLVGTTPATYGSANGWQLESNNYTVTLLGSSCDLFKAGSSTVDISFPCDPGVVVTGR